MILDSKCIHWWIIGDHSVGHCKKCGAVLDFEQMRQAEKTHRNIDKRKKGKFSLQLNPNEHPDIG